MKASIDVKLVLALAGVAIIWGTTYLGIRVAVKTIPAWYVTAIRQSISSVILLAVLIYNKELKWIGWQDFKRQLMLSLLMVVIANGLTTVAEKTVSSGVASLVNSISPLLVFVISVAMGMQRGTIRGFIGTALGFLGIAFIFRAEFLHLLDPGYRYGILALLVAVSGWTAGTIYSKIHSAKPAYIFSNLFYQFSMAAVIQFVLAFVFSGKADVANWAPESILATCYLAVFGSVLGYFCYHYALKKVSASEVSILTYFNTIISIFLGWLILNEKVGFDLILATILIISGVIITNYKKKPVA